MISIISTVLQTKRREIINEINKSFYSNEMNYKNVNWSIKTILTSDREDHFKERFADLEFSMSKVIYVKIGWRWRKYT